MTANGRPDADGDVAVRHPGVAVLLDLQRLGLHRLAEPVQRADARVAAPGEDQLARAAGADQLVVDDVGGHPHQRQIALALADDLLPGGDRDQVGEALQRDGVPVMDQIGDGIGEGSDLGMCSHDKRQFGCRTVACGHAHTGGDRRRRPGRADARPAAGAAGHRLGDPRGARSRVRAAARARGRARAGDDGPDGRGRPRRADASRGARAPRRRAAVRRRGPPDRS